MRATERYYSEERRLYREAYDFNLRDEEVGLIVRKLSRHFKVSIPRYRFYGNSQSGSAGYSSIRVSHYPSMGLLIHEFAHYAKGKGGLRDIVEKVNNKGTNHHGLQFQATLSRIHLFAKGKSYWKSEIEGKRDKKVEKRAVKKHAEGLKERPEAKVLIRNEKILKKEAAIKRYEKKLQYYTRLYTTKIKKARRSIAALKRHNSS